MTPVRPRAWSRWGLAYFRNRGQAARVVGERGRPERRRARRASMARAPGSDQRMPGRFMRAWTTWRGEAAGERLGPGRDGLRAVAADQRAGDLPGVLAGVVVVEDLDAGPEVLGRQLPD